MHIELHVSQSGETAWCAVVPLNQGCQGFQCVLNVFPYKSWHSIDLLEDACKARRAAASHCDAILHVLYCK